MRVLCFSLNRYFDEKRNRLATVKLSTFVVFYIAFKVQNMTLSDDSWHSIAKINALVTREGDKRAIFMPPIMCKIDVITRQLCYVEHSEHFHRLLHCV